MVDAAASTVAPSVDADLVLRFASSPEGRTYINHQFSRYPFHVCRAQYMDAHPAELATVYLQSSAGGVFAGDRLNCEVQVLPGARAHVTSQASTVVHRMDNGEASYQLSARVERGGFLEYLPDPLILFPNADLRCVATVRMHPNATVILGDAFLAHDPAARAETFTRLHNEVRIEDLGGNLRCLDRNVVSGAAFTDGAGGVMAGNRVQGTLFVLGAGTDRADMAAALRAVLDGHSGVYGGVSTLPGGCGVWARLLALEATPLRAALDSMWRQARKLLLGAYPGPRRK